MNIKKFQDQYNSLAKNEKIFYQDIPVNLQMVCIIFKFNYLRRFNNLFKNKSLSIVQKSTPTTLID